MDASTRGKGVSALSPSMAFITLVSVIIEVVNFFTLHVLPGCLSGSLLFGNPILRVFTLVANYFLHPGIITLIISLILFIPLGSMFERRLGSISFLYHFFVVLGIPMAIIYLVLIYFASFTISSLWMTNCAEGLLPMAFAFITVECFQTSFRWWRIHGLALLGVYFLTFFPFIGPDIFLIYNIAGILTGLIYSLGFLNILVPKSTFFTSLEDSALCSWMLKFPTFVPNAGVITLPSDSPSDGAGLSVHSIKAGYGALGKNSNNPASAVDEDEEALLRGP
ncbi:hypothetical protein BC829DRAFT_445333 [Chytridium lagenaria]|nr:hypothetical protein BC829DRAFT_445333 [Chytridium lagenaria]